MTSTKVPPRSLAFCADVHGNLPALNAVLSELERQAIGELYVAGDLLLGGDEPLEVWQRLQQAQAKCIRGISDLALANIDPANLIAANDEQRHRAERFVTTRRSIGELILQRLRRLPERRRIPLQNGGEILVVHGSPADPYQDLTHDMSDDELRHLLDDDPADVIVCGGSHVPFQRSLGELTVVGLGSVGEAPEGRVAHYTVITPEVTSVRIEPMWTNY